MLNVYILKADKCDLSEGLFTLGNFLFCFHKQLEGPKKEFKWQRNKYLNQIVLDDFLKSSNLICLIAKSLKQQTLLYLPKMKMKIFFERYR